MVPSISLIFRLECRQTLENYWSLLVRPFFPPFPLLAAPLQLVPKVPPCLALEELCLDRAAVWGWDLEHVDGNMCVCVLNNTPQS